MCHFFNVHNKKIMNTSLNWSIIHNRIYQPLYCLCYDPCSVIVIAQYIICSLILEALASVPRDHAASIICDLLSAASKLFLRDVHAVQCLMLGNVIFRNAHINHRRYDDK